MDRQLSDPEHRRKRRRGGADFGIRLGGGGTILPSVWLWLPSRSGAGGRAEVGEGVAGEEKGTVAKQPQPRHWAEV